MSTDHYHKKIKISILHLQEVSNLFQIQLKQYFEAFKSLNIMFTKWHFKYAPFITGALNSENRIREHLKFLFYSKSSKRTVGI